jgi:cyclophilin family peptidyl-prolyl cis-trans isomerase
MKHCISIAFAILLFAGCDVPTSQSQTTETTATIEETTAESTETVAAEETAPPAAQEKPMESYQNKVAELKTSKGTITIGFYPEKAPNHVRNFIDLSSQGFYNLTKFHRTIPGFMIQGGDPYSRDMTEEYWGTGGSGKNVKAEFNDIKHKRGIVSMARSNNPDSASSQFFIMVADYPSLDNQYTAFGRVLSGMDVADAIVAGKTRGDKPIDAVVIQSITIRDAKEGEKP